eukprot:211225-Hanusia_phi.AAC.1
MNTLDRSTGSQLPNNLAELLAKLIRLTLTVRSLPVTEPRRSDSESEPQPGGSSPGGPAPG